MKKFLIAALIASAPMAAMADEALVNGKFRTELSDAALSDVSGQAGLSPAQTQQIITGLQQTAGVLNAISPILPSQGKSVVTIVNSAATLAPIVNNLVNGGQPSAADIGTMISSGVKAGIAIGNLSSGL